MKEASQTDVEGISCDSLEGITPAQTDRQTDKDNKQLKQSDTQSFPCSTDPAWLRMTPIKHQNTHDL